MMAGRRYVSLSGILSSLMEKRFPRWLREEMLLVPVREAWRRLPPTLRAGCAPVAIRGRTLIVGVDGSPRMTEMSFHRARIIKLLADMGLVFEDIKFRPESPDRLPVYSGSGHPESVGGAKPRPEHRPANPPADPGLEELTRQLMSAVRRSSSASHRGQGASYPGTKGRDHHD